MKDQESTTRTPPDREIAEAASAVYRKYGTNLSAFWRDAFAAEAQRHGDQVERYGVDGNCIHSIPICHACQVTGVEVHIKETDRIRTGIRNEVYDAALAVLCDPDVMDDPDQANTLAGRIADRSREYLTAAAPAPQPALDAGEPKHWKREAPTEPGWYWFKHDPFLYPDLPATVAAPKLLMVYDNRAGGMRAEDTVNSEHYWADEMKGYWNGPIVAPEFDGQSED